MGRDGESSDAQKIGWGGKRSGRDGASGGQVGTRLSRAVWLAGRIAWPAGKEQQQCTTENVSFGSCRFFLGHPPHPCYLKATLARCREQGECMHRNTCATIYPRRTIDGYHTFKIKLDKDNIKVIDLPNWSIMMFDVDHARDTDTRRSCESCTELIFGLAMNWKMNQQKFISLHSTDSETRSDLSCIKSDSLIQDTLASRTSGSLLLRKNPYIATICTSLGLTVYLASTNNYFL